MAGVVCSEQSLAAKLAAVLPHLAERLRRLVMGAEARALGNGGIKVVARAPGLSAVTVSKGVAELDAGEEPLGRTRRKGGGRKPVTETDPGWGARCCHWSSPPRGVIRNRRWGGRRSRCAASPRRCRRRTCGFAAHGGETAQGGGV